MRRNPIGVQDYPSKLLESVTRVFGQGVTPYEAVARILSSVREERDAALKHWTEILDNTQLNDFRLPRKALASSFLDNR